MKTNKRENSIISLVRLNDTLGIEYILNHSLTIFGIRATISWRSKNNLWGRFGGGWNWKLGFQAGGSTVILNLLVMSITFYCKRKKKDE